MKSISIVIPVYNSAKMLATLLERLEKVLGESDHEYEIIFVEDAGQDASWNVISSLAKDRKRVRGIRLNFNAGQHNALLCGIREARYDTIVTMDDDLQHPPEEIPKLIGKMDEGYDAVYGVPLKKEHAFWRKVASSITRVVLKNGMGENIAKNISPFRIFKTNLREAFRDYKGTFGSIDVLLTWGTRNFAAVTVEHDSRAFGKSTYTIKKLITHAVNMMTGFSVLPLQVASMIGFLFTLFGIFLLGFVLVRYFLYGVVIPGFVFLASVITLFSGAQLFCLGIMGEYLARVHFRVMDRAPYLVKEKI